MAVDAFRDALAATIADPTMLDGFGLERVSISPPLWYETLTLDGRGNGALRTLRSIADANGEPIGEFRARLDPSDVTRLVRILHDTDFAALRPARIEAIDMRIELSILIDGLRRDYGLAVSEPDAIEPAQALLQELDRLAFSVRTSRTATLTLKLEAPATLAVGDGPVNVRVTFENAGVLGAWIAEPALLNVARADHEKMLLLSWEAPPDDPNVAPLPAVIEESRLESALVPPPRPYLWLPAASSVTREFVARPPLRSARPHYLAALYSSYQGGDVLVGRKRLRGAAFSDLLKVDVG